MDEKRLEEIEAWYGVGTGYAQAPVGLLELVAEVRRLRAALADTLNAVCNAQDGNASAQGYLATARQYAEGALTGT